MLTYYLKKVGEELDMKNSDVWNDYVKKGINGSFYQSYSNIKAQENFTERGIGVVIKNENEIVIVATCFLYQFGISIPYGPVFLVMDESALLFLFHNLIEKYNKAVYFSLFSEICDEHINIFEKFKKYGEYHTIILPIKPSHGEQLKLMNKNRRRIVKRVLNNSKVLEIEKGLHNLKEFSLFYEEMQEQRGELSKRKDLNELLNYENSEYVELYVCRHQGRIISGILGFNFGNVFESRYNANDKKFNFLNAGTYLDIWLINDLRERKIKYYDFAGYEMNAKPGTYNWGINYYKYSYGGAIRQVNMYKIKKVLKM